MKRYRSIVLIVISTLALSLFISASLRVSDRAQASPMWLEPAVPVTSRRALDVIEGISVTALTLPVLSIVEELSTSFTYQGQLKNNDQPVNADCSLAFRLYDAAQDGVQVGSPITRTVTITDGLFTVALDFGADVFTGDARWLGIRVQCPGDANYTDLARQPITAAPYALYALGAPWSGLRDVPPGFADGIDDVSVVVSGTQVYAGEGLTRLTSGDAVTLNLALPYRLPQTCANGQIAEWNGAVWVCGNDDVGIGGAYWSLNGNAGTNPLVNFLGTTDAVSLTLAVNGAPALRLEPNATSPNVVGGYGGNVAWPGVYGASIGGGGAAAVVNGVYDLYGTVGGGVGNAAYGEMSTVSGGGHNAAGHMAIVGGGEYNHAEGDYSVVAGGDANHAALNHTFVGGGLLNYAGGPMSVIGGGESISVTGYAATVAGGAHIIVTGDYAAVGGGSYNTASGTLVTIGGGGSNTASGGAATIGGGVGNTVSGGNWGTVSGGYNNTAADYSATIGGGFGNLASNLSASVGGGNYNTAGGAYATIAGGQENIAAGGYSAIGGGYSNEVTATNATVGGGYNNTANGYIATVGGGVDNTANGAEATVGGGWENTASGQASTISGGYSNEASATNATVGGGWNNAASNNAATVPGGAENTASGGYSFAAGAQATASHAGSFVWSSAEATSSWGDRTFTARAHGGVRFYTASGTGTGAVLPAGSGSWGSLSDRSIKANFAVVDERDILARLAAIPIQTWNYTAQDPVIRHIGPMAQDFYAAFGVGEDERYISTIDADGVALAAIQALYAENQALESRVTDLEARLAALESQANGSAASATPVPWMLAAGGLLAFGVVVAQRRRGGGVG